MVALPWGRAGGWAAILQPRGEGWAAGGTQGGLGWLGALEWALGGVWVAERSAEMGRAEGLLEGGRVSPTQGSAWRLLVLGLAELAVPVSARVATRTERQHTMCALPWLDGRHQRRVL